MVKRDHLYQRIAEFKERFVGLPTAKLVERVNSAMLQKEAVIAIREILDERTSAADVTTIYVALNNEGVEVWRPVHAASLGEGTFQIVSANNNPADEHWQFSSGAVVRCETRVFSDGQSGLVAIAAAELPR